MKITGYLILVMMIIGGSIYWYRVNIARYQFEGADEPGYYFPDDVRADVLAGCEGAIRRSKKTLPAVAGKQYTDEKIEAICECFLDHFEEKYSFKAFDKKYLRRMGLLAVRAKVIGYTEKEFRNVMSACAYREMKK